MGATHSSASSSSFTAFASGLPSSSSSGPKGPRLRTPSTNHPAPDLQPSPSKSDTPAHPDRLHGRKMTIDAILLQQAQHREASRGNGKCAPTMLPSSAPHQLQYLQRRQPRPPLEGHAEETDEGNEMVDGSEAEMDEGRSEDAEESLTSGTDVGGGEGGVRRAERSSSHAGHPSGFLSLQQCDLNIVNGELGSERSGVGPVPSSSSLPASLPASASTTSAPISSFLHRIPAAFSGTSKGQEPLSSSAALMQGSGVAYGACWERGSGPREEGREGPRPGSLAASRAAAGVLGEGEHGRYWKDQSSGDMLRVETSRQDPTSLAPKTGASEGRFHHPHGQPPLHYQQQQPQKQPEGRASAPSTAYGIPRLGKTLLQLLKGGISRASSASTASTSSTTPTSSSLSSSSSSSFSSAPFSSTLSPPANPPPAAAATPPSSSVAGPALPLLGATTAEIDRLTGHRSLEVYAQMRLDERRNRPYYGLSSLPPSCPLSFSPSPDAPLPAAAVQLASHTPFPSSSSPVLEAQAFLQNGHRCRLVGWLVAVGDKLRMRRATVHVAIAFLDRLFERHVPPKEKWPMLGVSCLQVAAKYEEAEENVPAVSQLSRASGIGLSIQTVQRWEVAVLEGLGWQLTCIVPLHFVEFYMTRGVLFWGDTVAGGKQRLGPCLPPSLSAGSAPTKPWGWRQQQQGLQHPQQQQHQYVAPAQLRKHAHFFSSYLLVHEFPTLALYLPSFVAALLLYLARISLGIAPAWREELVTLTGVEESALMGVAARVLRSFQSDYPQYLLGPAGAVRGLPDATSSAHYASVWRTGNGGHDAGGEGAVLLPDPPPFDFHSLPRRTASA